MKPYEAGVKEKIEREKKACFIEHPEEGYFVDLPD